jgi:hypothetical protein
MSKVSPNITVSKAQAGARAAGMRLTKYAYYNPLAECMCPGTACYITAMGVPPPALPQNDDPIAVINFINEVRGWMKEELGEGGVEEFVLGVDTGCGGSYAQSLGAAMSVALGL